MSLSTIFQYCGRGNKIILNQPLTCNKSLTNFIVWSKTSQQVEMKVTTLVVIGTDCIGRYKHYYLRAQLQFIKKTIIIKKNKI